MKEEQLNFYKEMLLKMKYEILKDLGHIEAEHINHINSDDSAYPIHFADVADKATEADLGFRLKNNEEKVLSAIENALKRIDEGTYGICIDCGVRIQEARLKAVPFAVRCIHCKAEYDKKNIGK